MDIGHAAEVFAHHIERLSGGLDANAKEELNAAVQAFHRTAQAMADLKSNTIGLQRFGGALNR